MGNAADVMSYLAELFAQGQLEDERNKANKYMEGSRHSLDDLEASAPDRGDLSLEGSPERVGESRMDGPEAQAMRQQQLRALSRLQRASEEGYSDIDRAAMNDALSETNQQERGNRLAIQQRLGGNSGAAIAAQLSNNQAAAQRSNNQGLSIAGGSRARALQALGQYGDMASGMRGQEMQLGAQNDAIAKFNAANSIDSGSRNADRSNQWEQQGFRNRAGLYGARRDYNDTMAGRHDQLGVDKVAWARRVGQGSGSWVDLAQSANGGGEGGGGGFMDIIKQFKGGK